MTAPWLDVDPTIEHLLAGDEHMGVMVCTCTWFGDLDDARSHALAVEDRGGPSAVEACNWQEATFGIQVATDRIDWSRERFADREAGRESIR